MDSESEDLFVLVLDYSLLVFKLGLKFLKVVVGRRDYILNSTLILVLVITAIVLRVEIKIVRA